MKKLILATIASAVITVPVTSHALNDREQGVLAGIVGTLILQHVVKNPHGQTQQPPVVVQQPAPVIIQPRVIQPAPVIVYPVPYPNATGRQYCSSTPYHDHHGRLLGYTYTCH